jgi:hypothetical protein
MLFKNKKKSKETLKYIVSTALIGLFICAIFMATIPASLDSPIAVSTLGTTVSGIGTRNATENNETENAEEIKPENTKNTKDNETENTKVIEDSEPEYTEEIVDTEETVEPELMGIEELLANAFNCSEDIIFAADSSYSLISKEFFMEFLEINDKNEEPRMPEIHDCDNFAMEFLMEIDAECAMYGIVPGVGVIWVKDYDAEDENEGHAVNFWINPEDKSVWVFDPQTDEEYSLEDQVVTFVYI